ncbi:cupin domain-containing protein [Acetanaerobacterium elongatum]|uniref:Cupin domain-containing protein n=1 Tax=Acetanaerobacterium elongatum TaxID=258515 RepID=A0A1G9WAT0_9FIRM|nr:cupin domain-containing protein [Acetanaerobacterium elongatum]SDM81383.1 Cupin domain-containing protein [Acetanaerobacterium elongatum]
MSSHYLKNIDFEAPLALKELVSCQPGQVVSRTLAQNKAVSITLFAFDKGEEISSHRSEGDAMVVLFDGNAEITIGDNTFTVGEGQTIVMPAGIPHALKAVTPFKMLLTVVFKTE